MEGERDEGEFDAEVAEGRSGCGGTFSRRRSARISMIRPRLTRVEA